MEKLKKFWSILGIALCFSLAGLGGTKKLGNVNNEGSPSAEESPSSQSVSSGSAPINYGRFSTNRTLVKDEFKKNFNFKNDDLYLFAFKVGQGNFVLLRHQKDVVIVDAGIDNQNRKIPSLEKIFEGANVRYVFLTHPHVDHWSFFRDLKKNYKAYKKYFEKIPKASYMLCGKKESWDIYFNANKQEKKWFANSLLGKLSEVSYLSENPIPFDWEDITIKIFCTVCNIPNKNYANQLSPFIKIEYASKSILCTGDCEGINFDLLFRRSVSLDPIIYYSNDENVKKKGKELKKNFKKHVSGDVESGFAEKYFKFYSDYRKRGMPSLKNLYSLYGFNDQETLMHQLITIEQARNAIKTSDIVVLPHHGTCTENSQRLLGYFCGQKEHKQLFIVSSDPNGRDGLPKASTIEMAPAVPEIFHHPFLYCRYENTPGRSKNSNPQKFQVQLKITKKPILLTEAAENDFQCVKITANREIKIWNGKEKKWYPFNQNSKTNENHSDTP